MKPDTEENIVAELVDKADVSLVDSSHAAGDRCPVCGCGDWFIIQNPTLNTIAVIAMASSDGERSVQGGVPTVTLTCQSCGFVRQHVKQIFDHYVKALKDKQP